MIYQLVVALAVVAAASAKVFPEDPTHQKYMWESFKLEHGYKFPTMEEETRRFGHFLENLKMADIRNEAEKKAGGSAVHGVTKFSHLSQVEFESTMLTANKALRSKGNRKVDKTVRKVDTTSDLVDWTGIYTTPVKNQGYCGSCWAFSATEQIESDTMRTTGVTYTLSPEQIVQCATKASGCNGGWTEVAYEYIMSAGGIVTEAAYPYTSYYGTTGACNVDLSKIAVSITGYGTVEGGEDSMAAYVQSTGPLSVCLDASTWNSYTGGIMSSCGTSVDHCVQAVGVDVSGGYWKVRNQWGTSWGESGFIQLAYGQNTCDITNDPTFVTFD